MRSERFLEIFQLVKAYPNPFGEPLPVVDGFDLLVPQGELVSVIGHSGCGKSTVLTMIAGLNPITSGGIIVDGHEIDGPGPDRAVVFQAPCLLPWMTALGNVMLGIREVHPGLPARKQRELAGGALELVGLGGALDRYPRELSGGMQQRVGIARAIALEPKLLLLDEPFGRLDSLTRMELQDVILRIIEEKHLTTLLITHDIDEAVFMSDRIVMMTNGPRARIGEILSIPFPRPRDRAVLFEDPEFYRCREALITFLEERQHAPAAANP